MGRVFNFILGRAIDFEGSRSEKDILNFVNRASGPAVKEPKKTLAALGNIFVMIIHQIKTRTTDFL